jgi:hypothetical protein
MTNASVAILAMVRAGIFVAARAGRLSRRLGSLNYPLMHATVPA